jgi:hypothetical protein
MDHLGWVWYWVKKFDGEMLESVESVEGSFRLSFIWILSVYTTEQLTEKYSNMTFLFYCLILILLVALHHYIYRWGLEIGYHFSFVLGMHLQVKISLFSHLTLATICKRREIMLAISGQDLRSYWHMLLPFSYVVVSGAVGSFSVLFAKSLYASA